MRSPMSELSWMCMHPREWSGAMIQAIAQVRTTVRIGGPSNAFHSRLMASTSIGGGRWLSSI